MWSFEKGADFVTGSDVVEGGVGVAVSGKKLCLPGEETGEVFYSMQVGQQDVKGKVVLCLEVPPAVGFLGGLPAENDGLVIF